MTTTPPFSFAASFNRLVSLAVHEPTLQQTSQLIASFHTFLTTTLSINDFLAQLPALFRSAFPAILPPTHTAVLPFLETALTRWTRLVAYTRQVTQHAALATSKSFLAHIFSSSNTLFISHLVDAHHVVPEILRELSAARLDPAYQDADRLATVLSLFFDVSGYMTRCALSGLLRAAAQDYAELSHRLQTAPIAAVEERYAKERAFLARLPQWIAAHLLIPLNTHLIEPRLRNVAAVLPADPDQVAIVVRLGQTADLEDLVFPWIRRCGEVGLRDLVCSLTSRAPITMADWLQTVAGWNTAFGDAYVSEATLGARKAAAALAPPDRAVLVGWLVDELDHALYTRPPHELRAFVSLFNAAESVGHEYARRVVHRLVDGDVPSESFVPAVKAVLGVHANGVEQALADAHRLKDADGLVAGVELHTLLLCRRFWRSEPPFRVPPSLEGVWATLVSRFAASHPRRRLDASGELSTVEARLGTRVVSAPLDAWAVLEALCDADQPTQATVAQRCGLVSSRLVALLARLRHAGLVAPDALRLVDSGPAVRLDRLETTAVCATNTPPHPPEAPADRTRVVAALCARFLKDRRELAVTELAVLVATAGRGYQAPEIAAAVTYLVANEYAEWAPGGQKRLVYLP